MAISNNAYHSSWLLRRAYDGGRHKWPWSRVVELTGSEHSRGVLLVVVVGIWLCDKWLAMLLGLVYHWRLYYVLRGYCKMWLRLSFLGYCDLLWQCMTIIAWGWDEAWYLVLGIWSWDLILRYW